MPSILIVNRCIIYMMGVSGSGKTTIGKLLAKRMALPFFDADDFHSKANKDKMKAGHPLTDDDRAGWLNRINQLAMDQTKKDGAVIACSALKEKYRTVLSAGISVPLFWVFLQGSFELIQKRMQKRQGHYMPASLLSSQFETLQVPKNAITVDISCEPGEIVGQIIAAVKKLKT